MSTLMSPCESLTDFQDRQDRLWGISLSLYFLFFAFMADKGIRALWMLAVVFEVPVRGAEREVGVELWFVRRSVD